jgi:phosphoribosylamine---glycine ligase
MHATDGTLDKATLEWDRRFALVVVMAAAGYPASPRKGDVISGVPKATAEAKVFHAGTVLDAQGRLVTSGGRVLGVTALAESALEAQQRAYDFMRSIQFAGAQWRRDIGHRAVRHRS